MLKHDVRRECNGMKEKKGKVVVEKKKAEKDEDAVEKLYYFWRV